MFKNYIYWRPNERFLSELCNYLQNKRVLEIFAGNGYLASCLHSKGIEVISTSIFSGHDGHDYGMYFPVQEMEASHAVQVYGDSCDVLLMAWPTVTESVIKAVRKWPSKPFVFIGEVTNYAKHELGGCATDSFFNETVFTHTFSTYKGNYIEKAVIGNLIK